MDIAPLCDAAKPLSHSWPLSIHWWLSLSAADQGAWVSGLGSLAAVAVALGVTFGDVWRRRNEKKARAMVLASYLFADVEMSRVAFSQARDALRPFAEDVKTTVVLNAMRNAFTCVGFAETSKITGVLERLADLPPFHAFSLAALPDAVKAIQAFTSKYLNAEGLTDEAIHRAAGMVLDQIVITERRLTAYIEEFAPHFAVDPAL